MKRTRIVVVDDHALVRAGLRAVLEQVPSFEIAADIGDATQAIATIGKVRADVVLMDLAMPGVDGIDLIRKLVKAFPKARVLVLSMHGDAEHVRRAREAGASGYIVKSAGVGDLIAAIEAVVTTESWVGHEPPPTGDPLGNLTPRQREVLALIAEGHTTNDIARQLQLSVKTVESHRAQLMERLGIRNIAGLVRFAIRVGIVPAA